MGRQDEEDAEAVADPGEGVEEKDATGRVLGDEKVEEGERDGVAGEDVVAARAHALRWKLASFSQELSQRPYLAPDWLQVYVSWQPIRSQVSLLTQLLTFTKTQKIHLR